MAGLNFKSDIEDDKLLKKLKGINTAFNKLGTNVKKNTVKATKGVKSLETQTVKSTKRMSTAFNSLKGALSFAAVFAVLKQGFNFVKESINLYRVQAKAIAQVQQGLISTNNVAGKSLDELKKQAISLQKTSLFGDEEILQKVTAQLLTFTNIANTEFDRTQQVALDLSTRLDGDLKSAAIQLGKALNDPVANLSALAESGIQFTKEQKEMVNSFVETNQLAKAQDIILTELEKQYGGSAKASIEADGGVQKLIGSFTTLKEKIGEALSGGVFSGVKELYTFIESISDNDIQDFLQLFETYSTPFREFFEIGKQLLDLFGVLDDKVGAVGSVFKILNAIMKIQQIPLRLLLKGIEGLTMGFTYLFEKIGETETWGRFTEDILKVKDALFETLPWLKDIVTEIGLFLGLVDEYQNTLDNLPAPDQVNTQFSWTVGISGENVATQKTQAEIDKQNKLNADALKKRAADFTNFLNLQKQLYSEYTNEIEKYDKDRETKVKSHYSKLINIDQTYLDNLLELRANEASKSKQKILDTAIEAERELLRKQSLESEQTYYDTQQSLLEDTIQRNISINQELNEIEKSYLKDLETLETVKAKAIQNGNTEQAKNLKENISVSKKLYDENIKNKLNEVNAIVLLNEKLSITDQSSEQIKETKQYIEDLEKLLSSSTFTDNDFGITKAQFEYFKTLPNFISDITKEWLESSKAVKIYGSELEKLLSTFSELKKEQSDLKFGDFIAENSELAKDSLTEVSEILGKTFDKFSNLDNDLGEGLGTIADGLGSLIVDFKAAKLETKDLNFNDFIASSDLALDSIKQVAKGLSLLGDEGDAVANVLSSIASGFAQGGPIVGGLNGLVTMIAEVVSANQKLKESQAARAKALAEVNAEIELQNSLLQQQNDIIAQDPWSNLIEGIQNYQTALQRLDDSGIIDRLLSVGVNTPGAGLYIEGLFDSNNQLNTDYIDEAIQIATANGNTGLAELLERVQNFVSQSEQAFEEFESYVSAVFGNIGNDVIDAFEDMYINGNDATTSLEDSFSRMVQQMLKDAIQMALIQPYVDSLNASMLELGQNTSLSQTELQQGILENLQTFLQGVSGIENSILGAFQTADELAASYGFESAFSPDSAAMQNLTASTAESIASGIIDGLANGMSASEIYAQNFSDLMKNAILEALAVQQDARVQEFYSLFSELSTDGLTEAEITQLRLQYSSLISDLEIEFNNLNDILGGVFDEVSLDNINSQILEIEQRLQSLRNTQASIDSQFESGIITQEQRDYYYQYFGLNEIVALEGELLNLQELQNELENETTTQLTEQQQILLDNFIIQNNLTQAERERYEWSRKTGEYQITNMENLLWGFNQIARLEFISGETTLAYIERKGNALNSQIQANITSQQAIFQQLQDLYQERTGSTPLSGTFTELSALGELTEAEQALLDILLQAQDEQQSLLQLQAEYLEYLQETFTGTTSQAISDGIINGFLNGYTSAEDFAGNFQDLMNNAVIQSLQRMSEQEITDFYNRFYEASADGLTAEEIAQLEAEYNQIVSQLLENAEQLEGITGLNLQGESQLGSSVSTAGAISAELTEATASRLAGSINNIMIYTNKLSVNSDSILDLALQNLLVVKQIRDNTNTIVTQLTSIESNTRLTSESLSNA